MKSNFDMIHIFQICFSQSRDNFDQINIFLQMTFGTDCEQKEGPTNNFIVHLKNPIFYEEDQLMILFDNRIALY
jgi:hypothetical protein